MGNIHLVKYDKIFFDLSKEWFANDELRKVINLNRLPSDKERLKWFESLPNRRDYVIWGIDFEGKPIGACGLKHLFEEKAEWWMFIGVPTLWGKGLGNGVLAALLEIVKDMDIKEIYMSVQKTNLSCIHLHSKFGFFVTREDDDRFYMSKYVKD